MPVRRMAATFDSIAGLPRTCAASHGRGPRNLARKGGTKTHGTIIDALILALRRDDEGQGLAEYALILALIAIVAIIALIFLGSQVSTILSTVGASV